MSLTFLIDIHVRLISKGSMVAVLVFEMSSMLFPYVLASCLLSFPCLFMNENFKAAIYYHTKYIIF